MGNGLFLINKSAIILHMSVNHTFIITCPVETLQNGKCIISLK